MTLEEAIIHSREVAKEKRSEGCIECANEHEQLAEWLEELKTLRKAFAMCAGNIEYQEYFLQKARESNEN